VRCRWKVIRSFIMKSGCPSCASAAASSNVLGISRRKITLISTSIWAMPARSSALIALRYSVSIRACAHTNPIRQIVLTVTWSEKYGAALAVRCAIASRAGQLRASPPVNKPLEQAADPLPARLLGSVRRSWATIEPAGRNTASQRIGSHGQGFSNKGPGLDRYYWREDARDVAPAPHGWVNVKP
jgi:hypothetical protein